MYEIGLVSLDSHEAIEIPDISYLVNWSCTSQAQHAWTIIAWVKQSPCEKSK